jgi:hypothetical protein
MLTTEVSVIMQCLGAQDAQSCMPNGADFTNGPPTCMWRKGIVRAENTQVDTTNQALFETNFCHPPTIYDWLEEAPACLNISDIYSCHVQGCMWSTGRSLVPKSGFCQLEYVSRNASEYQFCGQFNQSNCGGQCRWYGDDSKPLNQTQLFTKEFCHPMVGANMSDPENWYACPTDASRQDCPSTCAYTNGAELIPDHGFCSPQNITKNITAIVDCSKSDKEQCGDW